MSLSETYCILPFVHLAISNAGNVQACCLSKKSLKRSNHEDFTVNRHSLSEIWKSQEIETLRSELLEGKQPANCVRCWTDERLGIQSKRIRDNETWKRYYGLRQAAPTPLWLDLKLGNLCNLKCRICNPHSSSKFGKEAFDLFKNFNFEELQKDVKWAEQEDGLFWKGMNEWLSSVEHFDIYGGEPFLSKPHFAVLEQSVKMGYSKKQTLHYNTNATIFPEKMLNEIWPHFKSVNIMFSVDGVGEQFEYQRFPARWNEVKENILKFQKYKYLNMDICFTVNVMNIWDFPEFYNWSKQTGLRFWINYLYDPKPFRAQVFSDSAKTKIETKLRKLPKDLDYKLQIEPLINFMWDQKFSEIDRKQTLNQIEVYDRSRNQNFKSVFPEAYSLLTQDLSLEAFP